MVLNYEYFPQYTACKGVLINYNFYIYYQRKIEVFQHDLLLLDMLQIAIYLWPFILSGLLVIDTISIAYIPLII